MVRTVLFYFLLTCLHFFIGNDDGVRLEGAIGSGLFLFVSLAVALAYRAGRTQAPRRLHPVYTGNSNDDVKLLGYS